MHHPAAGDGRCCFMCSEQLASRFHTFRHLPISWQYECNQKKKRQRKQLTGSSPGCNWITILLLSKGQSFYSLNPWMAGGNNSFWSTKDDTRHSFYPVGQERTLSRVEFGPDMPRFSWGSNSLATVSSQISDINTVMQRTVNTVNDVWKLACVFTKTHSSLAGVSLVCHPYFVCVWSRTCEEYIIGQIFDSEKASIKITALSRWWTLGNYVNVDAYITYINTVFWKVLADRNFFCFGFFFLPILTCSLLFLLKVAES